MVVIPDLVKKAEVASPLLISLISLCDTFAVQSFSLKMLFDCLNTKCVPHLIFLIIFLFLLIGVAEM